MDDAALPLPSKNGYLGIQTCDVRIAVLDFGAKANHPTALSCGGRRWNYDFNTMSGFDHLYFPMDLETHDSGAYHVARMTEPYLFVSDPQKR